MQRTKEAGFFSAPDKEVQTLEQDLVPDIVDQNPALVKKVLIQKTKEDPELAADELLQSYLKQEKKFREEVLDIISLMEKKEEAIEAISVRMSLKLDEAKDVYREYASEIEK